MSNHLIAGSIDGLRRRVVQALVAVGATVALTASTADAATLRLTASPSSVDAGDTVTFRVTGNRGRSCSLSVRRGAAVSLRRSLRRSTSVVVPSSSRAGQRIARVRCGGRTAAARFSVASVSSPDGGSAPATLADSEHGLGQLPVNAAEIAGFSAGDDVGGAGFSTRVPFSRGMRIRVSQGAGGGFSHGNAYTRNAIDLAVGAGTPVLAGFSGVVAAARGGCAPSGSYGCNSGWGNFVLLKHADGTCAIHAHLTAIAVGTGQRVGRYAQLGTVGSSGSSTGAHLHYDRMDCATQRSLPWAFEDAGSPGTGATIVSGNEPDAQPAPAPTPTSAPAPAPSAPRVVLTVDNRVTNGLGMREDTAPARLTTKPWIYCGSRGCNIDGTERGTGGQYDAAVCTTFGERTTNGNDSSAADDANPLRFESTRYYGVRLADGTFGLISEVWITPSQRGGLGLPGC